MYLGLFDTTCLIQNFVSTTRGDTRMALHADFYKVTIWNAYKPIKTKAKSSNAPSKTLFFLCKYPFCSAFYSNICT